MVYCLNGILRNAQSFSTLPNSLMVHFFNEYACGEQVFDQPDQGSSINSSQIGMLVLLLTMGYKGKIVNQSQTDQKKFYQHLASYLSLNHMDIYVPQEDLIKLEQRKRVCRFPTYLWVVIILSLVLGYGWPFILKLII